MTPRGNRKHRRVPLLIGLGLLLLGLAVAEIYGRRAALRAKAEEPDTTAAAAFEDLDEDGQPDALPIRRLHDQPGGDIVIAAIAASGGYAAWAAHEAAAFDLESVIFDEREAIVETRTDKVALKWTTPPRVRVEALDGSTVAALGAEGPWGAARGTDGRMQVGKGPGAWDQGVLRDHLQDVLRVFGLPYNLGDVGAALSLPEVVEGDSLDRVLVTWPEATGPGQRYELGFSRDPGDLVEVKWTDPGFAGASDDRDSDRIIPDDDDEEDQPPPFNTVLRLEDYQRMGFVDRPLRRTLYRIDADGNRRPVHEQRISRFRWEPEILDFEPPSR